MGAMEERGWTGLERLIVIGECNPLLKGNNVTQGIFVQDEDSRRWRRPNSKKEIREFMNISPTLVKAEATSWFGNEYDGSIANAPTGVITFVGPDPATNRRFYGTITVKSDGKIVVQ